MAKSKLETALLKQLPTKFAEAQINSRLEEVAGIRLWAAEQRLNAQTTGVQGAWPFGEDFDAGALEQIQAKYVAATSKTIVGGYKCPSCGEPDSGNRMNKKTYCVKCGVLMVKGEGQGAMAKRLDKRADLKTELQKLNPGLNLGGLK